MFRKEARSLRCLLVFNPTLHNWIRVSEARRKFLTISHLQSTLPFEGFNGRFFCLCQLHDLSYTKGYV